MKLSRASLLQTKKQHTHKNQPSVARQLADDCQNLSFFTFFFIFLDALKIRRPECSVITIVEDKIGCFCSLGEHLAELVLQTKGAVIIIIRILGMPVNF